MTDIVVTVPRKHWEAWLTLRTAPGTMRSFHIYGERPPANWDDLIYVLAHRRIRCVLTIERVTPLRGGHFIQAVMLKPVSAPGAEPGFKGWRRRWWDQRDEKDFPDWKTAGVFYPAMAGATA